MIGDSKAKQCRVCCSDFGLVALGPFQEIGSIPRWTRLLRLATRTESGCKLHIEEFTYTELYQAFQHGVLAQIQSARGKASESGCEKQKTTRNDLR